MMYPSLMNPMKNIILGIPFLFFAALPLVDNTPHLILPQTCMAGLLIDENVSRPLRFCLLLLALELCLC